MSYSLESIIVSISLSRRRTWGLEITSLESGTIAQLAKYFPDKYKNMNLDPWIQIKIVHSHGYLSFTAEEEETGRVHEFSISNLVELVSFRFSESRC